MTAKTCASVITISSLSAWFLNLHSIRHFNQFDVRHYYMDAAKASDYARRLLQFLHPLHHFINYRAKLYDIYKSILDD